MTSAEILQAIKAGKSFWVETTSERTIANRYAATLQIRYTTGADPRGGFYVCKLKTVRKPKQTQTA